MHSALIIYSPDSPENRKVVEAVRGTLDPTMFATTVQKASEASIVDITGTDLVIFGLQKTGASEMHPDFGELVRVFKGVTLAGWCAGFFSFGAEKATARMRKALKDTEISQSEEDPVFSEPKSGKSAEIADWARRLSVFFKETIDARR